MSKHLQPGAVLRSRSGETITVLEVKVPWAGRTNGVRFRYQDGEERTLPATSLRSFRPASEEDDRRRRYEDLARRAHDIPRLLSDDATRVETWVRRMDAGEPCVQLTVTAASLDVLHRALLAAGLPAPDPLQAVLDDTEERA